MKNLFKILLATASAAMLSLGWSCDPNRNEPEPEPEPTLEVKLITAQDTVFAATSAAFEIQSTHLESFVYKVEEGENLPSPDPVMLYAEAKEVNKITDKKQSVVVYGLEGSKKYTVHFAFKVAGRTKYVSKSLSTTTPKYDRLINVLLADRREIKVQFNAPADKYYRYIIMDKFTYNDMSVWSGDKDFLENGGAMAKGPQVVSYVDGAQYIADGDTTTLVIKPHTTFVVLYAECDSTGKIAVEYKDGGGGDWEPLMAPASIQKPMIRSYTEDYFSEFDIFLDPYAKAEIVTAPALVGEGEFTVTGTPTEYSATFSITPPASVKRYGAAIVPKSLLVDQVYPIVGKEDEGALTVILEELSEHLTGPVDLKFKNLQKDTVYVLTLIGLCDDSGDTQIVYSKEFTASTSTNPASELLITQVEAPEKSPYHVSFNVKAPKKDCKGGLYLMNYTKEWVLMIKDPVTYESFTRGNGVELKDTEVRAINSAEGLVMTFTSWEDTENLLSLVSFNQDEKAKGFTFKARSLPEPAKAKVESPLFSNLLGTWDVVYTAVVGSTSKIPVKHKFKTEIAGEPDKASSTFAPGDKQYNALHKFYKNQAIAKGKTPEEAEVIATETITEQFAGYKDAQAKYAKKYRDQNRLVMRGFAYNTFTGVSYSGPWTLFCDTYYNSYDNDQLFYDYGSKLFLEVKKVNGQDVLSMETDIAKIAPFSNYSRNKFVAGALDTTTSYMYLTGSYPVEIVDANTLKIKTTIKQEGKDIPFMTAYTNNGLQFLIHTYATTEITLTRATAAPKAAPATFINANDGIDSSRPSFEFKRTRLNDVVVERKTVELDVTKGIDKSRFEKMAKQYRAK